MKITILYQILDFCFNRLKVRIIGKIKALFIPQGNFSFKIRILIGKWRSGSLNFSLKEVFKKAKLQPLCSSLDLVFHKSRNK